MLSTKNLINTILFSIIFVIMILNIECMKNSLKNKQKIESVWYILIVVFQVFYLINCPIFPWSVF